MITIGQVVSKLQQQQINKDRIQMGQEQSSISQANRLYEMPLSQYRLKERLNSAISIWKHKSSPYQQLIESRMVVNTEEDLKNIYEIFMMRHMHLYLSPTRYLTCQQQGIKGCGGYYKGNIYVDSAITTLAMINDIPFFDSLHLFAVAVKGFEILYRKFGYFDVFEDMFHIFESGKLKVWCNSQVYKLGPQPYLLDSSGKQDDMLYRIINIIDDNVDKSQHLNLKRLLYSKIPHSNYFKSFDEANIVFRQICKQNNWQPPQKLKCISLLTREQIEKLLQNQLQGEHRQPYSSDHIISKSTINQDKILSRDMIEGKTPIRVYPEEINQKLDYQPYTPLVLNFSEGFQTFSGQNKLIPNFQNQTIRQQPKFQQHNKSIPKFAPPPSQPHQVYIEPPHTQYQSPTIQRNRSYEKVQPKSTFRILSVQKTNRNYTEQNTHKQNSPIQIPFAQNFITPRPTYYYNSLNNQVSNQPIITKPVHIQNKFEKRITQNQSLRTMHSPPQSTIQPVQKLDSPITPRNFSPQINIQNTNHNRNNILNSNNFSSPRIQDVSPQNFQPFNVVIPPKYSQKNTSFTTSTKLNIQPTVSQRYYINYPQPHPQNSISYEESKHGTNIVRSVIINEPTQSPKSSVVIKSGIKGNEAEYRGPLMQNLHKNKESVSKIIENNLHSVENKTSLDTLPRNFEQRFQQSIQPQSTYTILNKQELTLRNLDKKYGQSKPKGFQAKKQQILTKNPNYRNSSKLKYTHKFQSDFTDPRLMQLLSEKDRSSITISPTFNVTLNREPYISKNLEQKQKFPQNNEDQGQNELFYSFSQGMMKDLSAKKDSKSVKYSQTEETVLNSQSSYMTKRKYQVAIDEQIWKDFLQLKKNKNFH